MPPLRYQIAPWMLDSLECIASVLLPIDFGHLLNVGNVSWAAFSGYIC